MGYMTEHMRKWAVNVLPIEDDPTLKGIRKLPPLTVPPVTRESALAKLYPSAPVTRESALAKLYPSAPPSVPSPPMRKPFSWDFLYKGLYGDRPERTIAGYGAGIGGVLGALLSPGSRMMGGLGGALLLGSLGYLFGPKIAPSLRQWMESRGLKPSQAGAGGAVK